MRRDSKLVRGLVDWLLGGITARLDFVEQDLKAIQNDTKRLESDQRSLTQTVESQQQQLQFQARQMIALRKMHALLSQRVGKEFPGQRCEVCGSALIFRREPARNAYSLKCPNECGKTLLLPETLLLNSMQEPPPSS